jgi:hypothetical protein
MPRLIASALAVVIVVGGIASTAHAAPSATTRKAPTTTILRGAFTDSAKYSGSGSVAVTRRSGVRTLRLARNFRADPGSIRLRLYVATDRSGRDFVDLGPMAETGAQSFRVPRRLSFSRYRYVIAWCAAVDEPITQARLIRPRR